MVVSHFDDDLGAKRLPFARALGAPSTRTAGGAAGETRWLDKLFEAPGECRFVARRQGRGEADVVQQAGIVVKSEQQRADKIAALAVTEPADNTIRGARELVFLHSVAAPGQIGEIGALG